MLSVGVTIKKYNKNITIGVVILLNKMASLCQIKFGKVKIFLKKIAEIKKNEEVIISIVKI